MGKLSQAIAHNGAAAAGPRQLRRLPRHRARTRRPLPGAPGELGQPRPHRGAEDRGVRGRRGARRRAGLPLHPGRQRRQLHRVLPRLPRGGSTRGVTTRVPRMFGFQAAGSRADRARRGREEPRDDRQRDPHRQPGIVGARPRGARGDRRLLRRDRRRRASSPRTATCSRRGRHLRRARLGDQRRRPARAGRRPASIPKGATRRAHGHRPRPQGPAVGAPQRRTAAEVEPHRRRRDDRGGRQPCSGWPSEATA